jgi:2-polyprenyl-6-methoxyphenol hydroxylase-like FAD-dependent oxidoreductase
MTDFPTRHNYGLALWQNDIERILAGWVGELAVPVYRGREVTGFTQDDTRVDVELSDVRPLRVFALCTTPSRCCSTSVNAECSISLRGQTGFS